MHGLIFNELRKYANSRFGDGAWGTLLEHAKLGDKMYLATQNYADDELVKLVTSAAAVTGREASLLLEDFGEFIVPDLLGSFRSLVRSDWRTLDVLENVESTIHRVVRLQVKDAAPPRLQTARLDPSRVRISYGSPRRLCLVAKGIIKGLAKHYRETVEISEPECMLRGASACVIDVASQAARS